MEDILNNKKKNTLESLESIKIPYLGEGIEKVKIAFLHVEKGDKVKKGDECVDVTTDKASFTIESEFEGQIEEVCVNIDDEVNVREKIFLIKGD